MLMFESDISFGSWSDIWAAQKKYNLRGACGKRQKMAVEQVLSNVWWYIEINIVTEWKTWALGSVEGKAIVLQT